MFCGIPGPQICPLVRVLRQIVLTFCCPLKVTPAHFHIHRQQIPRTPQRLSIGHPLSKPQSHRMNGVGWGMWDTIVGMQCCWKPPPNHANTHTQPQWYIRMLSQIQTCWGPKCALDEVWCGKIYFRPRVHKYMITSVTLSDKSWV